MVDAPHPTEHDAVLGNQVSVPVGAAILGGLSGVRNRLASPHLISQIGAISEASKYGEAGFDLIIQFLQDKSIEPAIKRAGKTCVDSILRDTLVTDDLGWYLVAKRQLSYESKIDTLRLACKKLLSYIATLYGKNKWYLDGGYSYIIFSKVQDWEWAQGKRKSLSKSMNYLVQILSAEKLRRVRILNFVYYCHTYYDIAAAYQKEILTSKFDKNLESKLLSQGIYHSLLPLFEEAFSALVSSVFEDLVIE
ncbi:hypothetical protein QUB00_30155 [Microcoleus sp. F8_C2]